MGAPEEPRWTGRKILVVEDSLPIREFLRSVLERTGASVLEAEDGQEALGLLPQAPPDLVITDLSLPRLSGFALIEAIRKTPALEDLPVLAMSSHEDTESVAKALEAGANAFLPKPFTAREVWLALAKVGP